MPITTSLQLHHIKVLIEELEKLRTETPKPKFEMSRWIDALLTFGRNKTSLRKTIHEATLHPCRTSACLAGKASLIPRIRRMGFRWDFWDFNVHGEATAAFHYRGYFGTSAVRKFFGEDVYYQVFVNLENIRTLLQGIKALKQFMERNEKSLH